METEATATAVVATATAAAATVVATAAQQSGIVNAAVVAAIVTAVAALIVAVLNIAATRSNQRDVERLRDDLQRAREDRNARRDYEYEARKRLYTECEPLLFQLAQMAEAARSRVLSLARSARTEDLRSTPDGWLTGQGYYLLTTMYRFVAPAAVFRLIQRRLTFVDLSLDRHIALRYELGRCLYRSYRRDFEVASMQPVLTYDPDKRVSDEERRSHPEWFGKQGIYAGVLDNLADALIVLEPDQPSRCMTNGEFEHAYKDEQSAIHQQFRSVARLFTGFHPRTRPVLWRLLVVQLYLHEALMRSHTESMSLTKSGSEPWAPHTEEERKALDWRLPDDTLPDEDVLVQPFQIAQAYLRQELAPVWHRLTGDHDGAISKADDGGASATNHRLDTASRD